MSIFGPDKIEQDFSFDPKYTDYQPSEGLTAGIGRLQGAAGQQMGLGKEFQQSYRQMLDPGSSFYQRMFGDLRKNVGDMASQTTLNMNQQLASRGVGRGGISSMLGAINSNQAGEQYRKGTTDIYNTGFGQAANFGQLASGAFGSAGSMYGQAGGLLGGIDDRRLQSNMQNAETSNAYNQYLNQSQYNQSVQNQNAQGAYVNSMLGLVGDIGAAAFTGGASIPGSIARRAGGGISNQSVMNNQQFMPTGPSYT